MKKEELLAQLRREVQRVLSTETSNNIPYHYSDKLNKKARAVLADIEKNHNTSWAMFMYDRCTNSKAMNKVANKYRGNKFTYGDIYARAFEYAKSLKAMGVKKGDQVPVCISDIPEYLVLLLACSFVGATIHLVGDWFDKDSLKAILNKSKAKTMFISEDVYPNVREAIEESNIDTSVLISLGDSLMRKNGKPFNPYQEIDGPNHDFSSHFDEFKAESTKNVINQEAFINYGANYEGPVLENCDLDDIATITYTSGTTENGCPKGVKHSNRVYISVSRFKSSDVSGMPEMKDLTTQFAIPTYSHTNISNVTDTFYCNCTYASEPFHETEFFMKSLLINKPNYVQSTIGRWIFLAKELMKKEYEKIMFPELMMADVVGEGCSPGEEKFLNKTARKHRFGIRKLPFPLSPVKFTLGGGTCEGGGLFFTLFHELQQKLLAIYGGKYKMGLKPVRMADVQVLNLEGGYCGLNEPGFLVVDSPANFSGYTDPSLDEKAYIMDKYGKKWIDMGTMAYKSDPRYNSIQMKSRSDDYVFLQDGTMFPTFRIEESISKDTKNIMSVTVMKMPDGTYVCHLEKQPDSKKPIEQILRSCALRLERDLPREIYSRIFFRVRSFDEGFPVAKSGKRNFKYLKKENNEGKLIYVEDVFIKVQSREKNPMLELRKN